jgi:type II restriction enzyme
MHLQMDASLAEGFTSASQRARVTTEAWAAANLYCVACEGDHLRPEPTNSKVVDFVCEQCSAEFQLKSQSHPFGRKVVDSGYEAMCRAIRSDRAPNLVLLHYDRLAWQVLNALIIPSFGFTLAAIEKREPLSPTARRAGWVGCNILLTQIPEELRLPIISDRLAGPPTSVRKQFRRMSALRQFNPKSRGWLIDVLSVIHSLKSSEFGLQDVYEQRELLSSLHPDNRNVEAKIRQQLQKLRDLGLIAFGERGRYRLKGSGLSLSEGKS